MAVTKLRMPITLQFDDGVNPIEIAVSFFWQHGVHVDIGPLPSAVPDASPNLNFSIDDDPAAAKVFAQMPHDIVGYLLLVFW